MYLLCSMGVWYINIQGLLGICIFSLCGFGFTHLRKMIIKKIVQFTTWNQLYAIFGHTQLKFDVEPKKAENEKPSKAE